MQKFKLYVSICLLFLSLFAPSYQASAASSSLVISQMYPGATGMATHEFVELYNNSSQAINVTGWCVTYTSSNGSTTTNLGCLAAPDNSTTLWLKAGEFMTFMSTEYPSEHHATSDVLFGGGIAATGGHIRILDAAKTEIDKLAWGSAVSPETTSTSAPTNGKSLQRKSLPTFGLQDTDNNADDFIGSVPLLHVSGLYEVVTVIDVCPNLQDAQATIPEGLVIDASGNCVTPSPTDVCLNIDGLQTEIPIGFMADEQGSCYQDMCLNIAGLQVVVPDGYDQEAGNCIEHDECTNLAGIQATLPYGYKISGGDCVLDLLPLQLTEILPNAAGSDTGHEYVEIFNPTDREADLGLYTLHVGIDNEKTYQFPAGSVIKPGEYATFYDNAMKFTLVNTASQVSLVGNDGTMIAQTDAYANPADNNAWAFIDSVWQYTDQPTPNTTNIPALPVIDEEVSSNSQSAPCPAGKYRHPLTNRCRNIESDGTVLTACDDDQYRNPETGRCRKVVTAGALAACKDGQYRSEETNRCRNIATAATSLAPCKEGQERNPDTNRCRNTTSKSVPQAAYAVEPVKDGAKSFVGWTALGGVGALAVGYAGWEWRREVTSWIRRIGSIFTRK